MRRIDRPLQGSPVADASLPEVRRACDGTPGYVRNPADEPGHGAVVLGPG